jgi:hypothetical protein
MTTHTPDPFSRFMNWLSGMGPDQPAPPAAGRPPSAPEQGSTGPTAATGSDPFSRLMNHISH